MHNKKGSGCYFEDLDGNRYLDFCSQIASNPLGYNHPQMLKVVKDYSKSFPVKYAGQDFTVKEHTSLIEELVSITPKSLNAAFIINSGAEAVENAVKIALRRQKEARYIVSFTGAFHGRTLGALSLTCSKAVQKQHYLSIPTKRLAYDESALHELDRILAQESCADEIGAIIIEAFQGEGGYRPAPKKLMIGLRRFTKAHKIPLICDEVQSGIGRTGKWWAFEHYGIKPDIFSSAKALQVGATVANRRLFPVCGSISSTWGGGQILDMALGIETIKIIKAQKLLKNISRMGSLLQAQMSEIGLANVRGLGLMAGFDLESQKKRDLFWKECLSRGLVLLGCARRSIRVIPPYIVSEDEINHAVGIMEKAIKKIGRQLKPVKKIDHCGC